MSNTDQSEVMDLPNNNALPLFVYGVLKPGMPAFEQLRNLVVFPFQRDQVAGELYVRDGLPLLKLNASGNVEGFLLRWIHGEEANGYKVVCEFEPRKHYEWCEITLESGAAANALVMRYPTKGNPQRLELPSWHLSDDPAFGPGIVAVASALKEVENEPRDSMESKWQSFFHAQMAYLLLWSILERLSALCFGPGKDPTERVNEFYELPGIEELLRQNVSRTDLVADSRNPDKAYRLDSNNAKNSFKYYYQVRSNLSH